MTRWWQWSQIFLFIPRTLGRWSNLTRICFKMGWFNHQLDDKMNGFLHDSSKLPPYKWGNDMILPQLSTPWRSTVSGGLKPRSFIWTKKKILVVLDLSNGILVVVSNIFYFHPYLGKISNLTNIFQMGWNHQLEFPLYKSWAPRKPMKKKGFGMFWPPQNLEETLPSKTSKIF